MKGHLAFALFLLTAVWLAPFREDAAKRYQPSTSEPCLLGSEENRGAAVDRSNASRNF